MSVAWNGNRVEVPCVVTRSFLDNVTPKVPRSSNCTTNSHLSPGQYKPSFIQPIEGIIWHTVHGTANGTILTDNTCSTMSEAYKYAEDFHRVSRQATSAIIIADNGVALNLIDLVTDRGWTTCEWNPWTIGIEIDQHNAGGICFAAINTAVQLGWWLSEMFGVQPMVPWRNGKPDLDPIERFKGTGARTFRGHYSHANIISGRSTCDRGHGDPGPAFYNAFVQSGAEGFDVRANQDRDVWRARQKSLGLSEADQDGIPGQKTVEAIRLYFGRNTWAKQSGSGCLSSKQAAPRTGRAGGASGLLMLGLLGAAGYYLLGRKGP